MMTEINFVIVSYSDLMYNTLLIEEHWKVAQGLNIRLLQINSLMVLK